MGTTNFGAAVVALTQGKRVQRSGWNGKGLYIFKQVPAVIDADLTVPKMQSLPESVKLDIRSRLLFGEEMLPDVDPIEFKTIKYKNQLCLMYPDNTLYGYSPSTSDLLATDWVILDIEVGNTEPSAIEKGSVGFMVEQLLKGKKITRKGWNAPDMYLYFVPAAEYAPITAVAKEMFEGLVPYRQYIAIKTAQGDVATWSPSNTDVFSNDWQVVNI